MGPTERLANTLRIIAQEFETHAGRAITPIELMDLAIHLDKTIIVFFNASIATACAIAWQALQEPAQ